MLRISSIQCNSFLLERRPATLHLIKFTPNTYTVPFFRFLLFSSTFFLKPVLNSYNWKNNLIKIKQKEKERAEQSQANQLKSRSIYTSQLNEEKSGYKHFLRRSRHKSKWDTNKQKREREGGIVFLILVLTDFSLNKWWKRSKYMKQTNRFDFDSYELFQIKMLPQLCGVNG